MTEVIVCCGVGGTGKTTTTAAMGVSHALAGKRVVVLTIDPARRLADALGVDELGNEPVEVPLDAPGSLHALMLDRKGTWDSSVRRFSPSKGAAERLLGNRYYRAVSERLTGSHEYMAIEKLYDLVQAERWDLVLVDTPPTQHALEFFRAPERLRRVLDRSMLNVFLGPGRGVIGLAGDRAFKLVSRLAGEHVMGDIREFFHLLSGLSKGFRERSLAVQALLRSDRTRYYVVASAGAPSRSDVLGFVEELQAQKMQFAGFLVNRVVLPAQLSAPLAPERYGPPPSGINAQDWRQWTDALSGLVAHLDEVADRHKRDARRLLEQSGAHALWLVPELAHGIRTLDGLASLAPHLPPAPAPE